MSILAEKLRAAGDGILDLLLPQHCLLCGGDAGKAALCPACSDELPALPAGRCPRCAETASGGETCGRCLRHPPHFDRMIAAFPYRFPVDRLIQKLKYGHQLSIASWLGRQLADACKDLEAHDLIVPMPLHRERMTERGFNQAIEIARPLRRLRREAFAPDCCTRTKPTRPQESLSLRERLRNLKGAFHCCADLSGRRILLIDDVVTSGASVNECARTLKLHGAASVTVATVARTLRD